MALRVNSSPDSSIPDNIIHAMTNLNSQFPEKWQGNWLASLISSQQNDDWEQKLTSDDGIPPQHCILSAEQQNSGAVCGSLLELRNTRKT
jgi:hypothetical protein